jgi:hypothetical protein
MKFLFGWTIVLLLIASVMKTAEASIRGASQVEHRQQDQVRHSHRRLSLPVDTECTLYKKGTQWEDGRDDEVWSCEFTKEQVTKMEEGLDTSAGVIDMLDIDGISREELDDTGIISGTGILISSTLLVQQSNDGIGEIKLVVPKSSSYLVKKLPEDDRRHYNSRKRARRVLQQSGRLFRTHRNSIMAMLEDDLSRYQDDYVRMKEDLRNT